MFPETNKNLPDAVAKGARVITFGRQNSLRWHLQVISDNRMAPTVLFVSDAHGSDYAIDSLRLMAKTRNPEAIIIGGDLTTRGPLDYARRLVDAARRNCARVIVEWGNLDSPEVVDFLKTQENIHGKRVQLGGFNIVGLAGANESPFNSPNEYSESEYAKLLAGLIDEKTLFAPHCPPYGTGADKIASGKHVGSKAIREAILCDKPRACVCGHIHESRAAEKLGETLLLKTGPLSEGFGILLDLDSLEHEFIEV